jgi:hypothetical protein
MNSQLGLFNESIGRSSRELRTARASSSIVEQELLDLFKLRPNEWLSFSDLYLVGERHDIRSQLGHVLFRMSQAGLIQSKNIYFGSDSPREKNYLGFGVVYMLEMQN